MTLEIAIDPIARPDPPTMARPALLTSHFQSSQSSLDSVQYFFTPDTQQSRRVAAGTSFFK